MKVYFVLQFKRLFRTLAALGFNPFLGMLLSIAAFYGISELIFYRFASYAPYLYAGIAIFVVLLLSESQRNEFLKNLFTLSHYRLVRLSENTIVLLPFLIVLLIRSHYLFSLGILMLSFLCSFYNRLYRSAFTIPTPFFKTPFEFIVGFRRFYLLLVISYLLGIVAVVVSNFEVGMLALLGVYLICMNFYSKPEPEYFVWIHADTAMGFLNRKLSIAARHSILLALPLVLLLMAFNFQKIHWLVLVWGLEVFYVLIAVVIRYASYPNAVKLPYSILLGIGILMSPVLLFLFPFFYVRSVKHLTFYFK